MNRPTGPRKGNLPDADPPPVSAEPAAPPEVAPEPWNSAPHLGFLASAFGISWFFWIAAWLLARSAGISEVLLSENLVWTVLFERDVAAATLGISVLSLLGVYGPAVAGLVSTSRDAATDLGKLGERTVRIGVGAGWYARLLLILLGVAVLPGMVVLLATGAPAETPDAGRIVAFIAAFFVFQLLTAGTEELGWRGYLLHKLQPGRNLWDAGWAVGVPWALWHLPIVLILFAQQGMPPAAMAGSFLGFGIGIVAMSILHAWFYANTRSVFFAILLHAAFNTAPLSVGLLLGESFAVALVSQLLLWGVVIVVIKRVERAGR